MLIQVILEPTNWLTEMLILPCHKFDARVQLLYLIQFTHSNKTSNKTLDHIAFLIYTIRIEGGFMDPRLEKALDFSNYMITLNNQRNLLHEKFLENCVHYINGGKFNITQELVLLVKKV